ncbi:MAG: S6e family ribosomal protein [Candidatus Aenigmatarchaeota archaeon]
MVLKMPVFRFVVSDGKESRQIEKDQSACPLIGKKIGDTFAADFLGLEGYTLKITGGSDKDGVPMRPDIDGPGRKELVLTKGIGFSGKLRGRRKKSKAKAREGIRKRKIVRGNTISADTMQINCRVEQRGAKPLTELLPKAEKKEEAKK